MERVYERNIRFAEAIANKLGLQTYVKKSFVDSIVFNYNIPNNATIETIEYNLVNWAVNESKAHEKPMSFEECKAILDDISIKLGV